MGLYEKSILTKEQICVANLFRNFAFAKVLPSQEPRHTIPWATIIPSRSTERISMLCTLATEQKGTKFAI